LCITQATTGSQSHRPAGGPLIQEYLVQGSFIEQGLDIRNETELICTLRNWNCGGLLC